MPHPIPRLRSLPPPAALDYIEESLGEQHRANGAIAQGLQGIRDELRTMNGKLEGLEGIRRKWDKVMQALMIAAAIAVSATVIKSWARSEEARAQASPPPQTIERQTR